MRITFYIVTIFCVFIACNSNTKPVEIIKIDFPYELVNFSLAIDTPVFEGTGDSTDWDQLIRERGWILKEDSTYFMWYTGHQSDWKKLKLGLATSKDGIFWERYAQNPIYDSLWTEDMMIVKEGDTYHMFAEGKEDIAHRLSSKDRIHWQEHGALDIRYTGGKPLSKGPYGTPTVIKEKDTWFLFYERNDSAVWLASSKDLRQWTNIQDEPVLQKGPDKYDLHGIAMNQVIKYNGKYYAYYHGTPDPDWATWNINVAVSEDKIHWTKYGSNPILGDNKSSGILVHDGEVYRMYSMHEKVQLHLPKHN